MWARERREAGSRKRAATVLALVVLVATGCVGPRGADGPSTPAVDPFGNLRIGADQPIEVGTLLATSGQGAALGVQSLRGVQLAVDYLDGKLDGSPGKLLGHDVQLLSVDEGCNPEGGRAGADILTSAPIAGVIGTTCSTAALGAADAALSSKGIVLVSPTDTAPELTAAGSHEPFYVRVAPNAGIQGAVVADFAREKLDASTAATLEDRRASAGAPAFRSRFLGGEGTLTGSAVVSEGDYKQGLAQVGAARPDVVYYAAPEVDPTCGLMPRDAERVPGLVGTALVSSGGCFGPPYLVAGGPAAVGTYMAGPDLTTIETGEFYKDSFAPAYADQFGNEPQGPAAAYGFDAASVLFDAIVRTAKTRDDGSLSMGRSALRDAIYATSDYVGLTGTISCTPLGDCVPSATIAVYRVPEVPMAGGVAGATPVYSERKSLTDLAP